jgi:hypothetical protein
MSEGPTFKEMPGERSDLAQFAQIGASSNSRKVDPSQSFFRPARHGTQVEPITPRPI